MRAISKKVNRIKWIVRIATSAIAVMAMMLAGLSTLKAEAKKTASASDYYVNTTTGYSAIVVDGADYLTDKEERNLVEAMAELTEYTNVIYVTDENNRAASESYSERLAESTAHSLFGEYESCVVYVVDNEYDYIYSQGKARKTITSAKAYSITDNVYRYSAREKYYEGAVEAYRECRVLFEGRRIAEPMKYICNAFIGLFAGFIICFLIISRRSKLKFAGYDDIIAGSVSLVQKSDVLVNFKNSTRTYSPRSSSGGGHGGHHGGGHHGGGHSGGGHSH